MIGNTTSSPFGNRQRPALSAIMLVLMGCLAVLSACGGEDSAKQSRGATSPAATVLAFTPTTGGVGTIITVTGTNFSTTQSVTIGGAPAIVLSQSGSALTALVMPGAVTGPVQVTRASDVLTSSGLFTVATPGVPTTQQGPKLIGTGAAVGLVQQGYSVALSADGATALVSGPADDANTGAAWVFTRTGGSWTQQGTKLVGPAPWARPGRAGPSRSALMVPPRSWAVQPMTQTPARRGSSPEPAVPGHSRVRSASAVALSARRSRGLLWYLVPMVPRPL